MSEERTQSGKPRNWFMKHKIMTVILVFIVLLIIGSIFGGSNGTSQVSDSSSNSATSQNAVVAIKITAVQLSEEYDANKVAADAKYKDKVLEVTGIIDGIGKDILDDPYVSLKGRSNSLFGIQCMFAKSDEQKLVALSKGSEITLTGKVSGELIGNVILRDCNF